MPVEPFIGEIMYFGGNTPPKNWVACNGQTLPIASNQALFVLLGTAFGGDGVQTFGLPDLRGRAMIGTVANGQLGAQSGSETYGLQLNEIPSHTHTFSGTEQAGLNAVPTANATLGGGTGIYNDTVFSVSMYAPSYASPAAVAGAMISNTGTGQGHENRQPYTVLTACIATVGVFPTRP